LTKAIAKQTSKVIDSKVRYDSWLLTWMKSTLEETGEASAHGPCAGILWSVAGIPEN